MRQMEQDIHWMWKALDEAQKAYNDDEVPVGCIIVHQDFIVGRGHNSVEKLMDPTAHAEILAISAAATTMKSWRLNECTLYVNLEPCTMCIGAIHLARIKRLVFGASDPKFGACGSIIDVPAEPGWNHKLETQDGILADESARLMRGFFKKLRQ
jgi:tRNA(adenine34) deaminase